MTTQEYLADDLRTAAKAADDYLDALNHLANHHLGPMDDWIRDRYTRLQDDPTYILKALP